MGLEVGASTTQGPQNPFHIALWNVELCGKFMERNGCQLTSRKALGNQWAQFLEVLEQGSPSVNATPEQMAKEVPADLVAPVNDQLARRGCDLRLAHSQIDIKLDKKFQASTS